ncbi:MAG: glycosyltransferase, partial [Methylophilaceae bacterium]|nr:glycosyltransferase [Methylophilaceae bacterium]
HALSHKLGLENNVRFLGYLDRNAELNACYQSADLFVFASKSETQGLVLLEAMAQATPVVAIAELGTKSILIEGEGALIAPDEEIEFANKVERVLSDKALRQQLSKAGLSYVKAQWTDKVQAERMIGFYQEVVDLKKQA